jgi:hypothetical protein
MRKAHIACMETGRRPQNGETEMTAYNIFANGTFWGTWEAETAEEAMQIAADEVGTVDVGAEHASTEGMTAEAA